MIRRYLVPLIYAGFLSSAFAQGGDPDALFQSRRRDASTFWFHYWTERGSAEMRLQAAARRQAEYLQVRFVERMNRIAVLWSKMATDYNEKRVFNLKLARDLSKAFRDLENSEGWPNVGAK